MTNDEQYMHRCLQLAALGAGDVAPNPLVGAVLVYNGRIIGEGFHAIYGQAHAEVNCLASVADADKTLIPESTMYVSLEPCAHFGKTPPCADRLIAEKVERVVIACRDPFTEVDGKGIEKLQGASVEVTTGVLEKEAAFQNRRFFTFHTKQRPYLVLKWAKSADGFIARNGEPTAISNAYTRRLVHKWRSEEAAIMIGKNTALIDNPQLNNRYWFAKSPVRLLVDTHLDLPPALHLFDGSQPTLIFNAIKSEVSGMTEFVQIESGEMQLLQIMQTLYDRNIQSVLVEGGAALLQSFIDAGLWDEARIITNTSLHLGDGVHAPTLGKAISKKPHTLESDNISIIYNHRQ